MQIIKASEIAEFYYCCSSWLLKKKGVKPQISQEARKKLEEGIERHEEIGKQITNIGRQQFRASSLKYIGYGILALVVFVIGFFLLK